MSFRRPLERWQRQGQTLQMKFRIWLRGLLSVFAVIGLISGPVIAQISCATITADDALAVSEMADDMPCCADGKPDIPDRQTSCPSMATCMAKCFSVAPVLSSLAFIFWDQSDAIRAGSDVSDDALAIEPSGRPPKT